jgi:hypothetical protein
MLINWDGIFSCSLDVTRYLVTRLADTQGRHWYIDMADIMVVIPILFWIMQCTAITWDVCVPTIIQTGKTVFYYIFGSKYFQKERISSDNKWVNKK